MSGVLCQKHRFVNDRISALHPIVTLPIPTYPTGGMIPLALSTQAIAMKLGSEAHKQLFCYSFLNTHLDYHPEKLPWPSLDDSSLQRLRSIPFWIEALDTERKAGAMVTAFKSTLTDPLIKEAVALQGREECRHAHLLQTLTHRYAIPIPPRPPVPLPVSLDTAFIDFGFEECLDSFFAFGLFGLARKAGFFPEELFTIFDPILDEEARHIVFFVNWFTYRQIQEGRGFPFLRASRTLWHYARAIQNLVTAFGGAAREGARFTAADAHLFAEKLTPQGFVRVCLAENYKRMQKFDPLLLQPVLLPYLCSFFAHPRRAFLALCQGSLPSFCPEPIP